jgi:hypothetical protein
MKKKAQLIIESRGARAGFYGPHIYIQTSYQKYQLLLELSCGKLRSRYCITSFKVGIYAYTRCQHLRP